MHEQWDQIISGVNKSTGAGLARVGLHLLSGLYGFGLAANHWIYDAGLKPHTEPVLPVVSVGNLSLGGTGKTTSTAWLTAKMREFCKPGIVLRGYRRREGADVLLVSDGTQVQASVAEAGDEAFMLAQQTVGCAVAVGKRRERVIEQLKQVGAEVAVLDDGFQYFKMKRTLDIVLLDALADERALHLFPAGRLREPFRNLRRADQIWITHADLVTDKQIENLKNIALRYCDEVVITCHKPTGLKPFGLQDHMQMTSLADQRVVALSALGNPEAFERSVMDLGGQVTPVRFADHHQYEVADWDEIIKIAQQAKAQLIITTAKDAVKLPLPPAHCPPVWILSCELDILEGVATVEARLIALRQLVEAHRGKS